MNAPLTLPAGLARRPGRRVVLTALAVLGLGSLGVGLNSYLGRGPAPITVTDTSGAATFNFRVTGIPVPGKIEGVTPHLTFSPTSLGATTGTVSLGLSSLNTGIALRDGHAREFLGAAKHPTAVYTLKHLNTAAQIRPGQTLNGSADGTLSLNGVAVPLKSPITLKEAGDGSAITVETAFNVNFARHHISIPGADPATDVKVIFRLPLHQ
ncbi:YceI family protein [Deinococcus sp. UYEF24]